MKQQAFKIEVTYFKASGKYYTDGTFALLTNNCGTDEHPVCAMHEVCSHFKDQLISGKPLPGLIGSWSGPILLNCEEGFPCLLLPRRTADDLPRV